MPFLGLLGSGFCRHIPIVIHNDELPLVFGGRPLAWRRRMSSLGPRIPTRSGWGHRGKGVMAQVLHSTQNMCVCVCVYFIVVSRGETKKRERDGLNPMDQRQSPALLASISRQGRPPGGHRCLQKMGDVLNRWQAKVNQDTDHPYESPRKPPSFSNSIVSNPVHPCVAFL
jgi:hypothetical protein